MSAVKTVLWWGNIDQGYSRNRIIKEAFSRLGWHNTFFTPVNRRLAYIEARIKRLSVPGIVFVPCFCLRDIPTAARFARHYGIPLLVDPLISLYDTRVFERKTVTAASYQARRLLKRERSWLARADGVLVDTQAHGRYFAEVLGVSPDKIQAVPVSAEEALFTPAPGERPPHQPVEVLFYGSFIPLQGVEVIVEAIRLYQGPPVNWCFLGGKGSIRQAQCKEQLADYDNVVFEDNLPYPMLPARIHQADILLGVFGVAEKTTRVIPNKVYQALACAKPVITCSGPYPDQVQHENGITWVSPGDPAALAAAVASLAAEADHLPEKGRKAKHYYDRCFNNEQVEVNLAKALHKLTSVGPS